MLFYLRISSIASISCWSTAFFAASGVLVTLQPNNDRRLQRVLNSFYHTVNSDIPTVVFYRNSTLLRKLTSRFRLANADDNNLNLISATPRSHQLFGVMNL